MGSQAPQAEDEQPLHVLVTGFGVKHPIPLLSPPLPPSPPFASRTAPANGPPFSPQSFRDVARNPSYLIAASLPSTIAAAEREVHIHVHPSPIRVSYKSIRATIPALLFPPLDAPSPTKQVHPADSVHNGDPHPPLPSPSPAKLNRTPNFDLVLFMGVAPGRADFALETKARRDGYVKEDVDGETMAGDTFWGGSDGNGDGASDEHSEPKGSDAPVHGAGYGAPKVLGTGVDVGDVWRRWRSALPDVALRPSNDAGLYLCEFIYYTGLVEYWRRRGSSRGKEGDEGGAGTEDGENGASSPGGRPVVFLHVPKGVEERDVKKGRSVAVELIRALVESRDAVSGDKERERDAAADMVWS